MTKPGRTATNGKDLPTLGVVAICYNEEIDLPGFLAHLNPWINEIVIIDDGSTDGTEAIAENYDEKLKFLVSPRVGGEYYSHQRNKGIKAAESDWLLHMDIDERVPPALAREILNEIRNPAKDAYRFRRLNHFLNRPMQGGGWQDWNLPHLARRETLQFGGMFHESCSTDCPDAKIGQLTSKMYHLNEDIYQKRLQKSDTYIEELTANIREEGGSPNYVTILGRTLLEFVKKYFLKMGFRDGTPGLISAMHSSTAVFRAHALVWDENNRVSREAVERSIQGEWAADTQIKKEKDGPVAKSP